MQQNREQENDPLRDLLAITPQQDAAAEQSVQRAVHAAQRHVGTHDVLNLMLVNLWQVLAQMLAPLFLVHKQNTMNKQNRKEINHG